MTKQSEDRSLKTDEGAALAPPQRVDAEGREPEPPAELIPEQWRGFIEEMLVSGLAVEDIAEIARGKAGLEIAESAILAHFRTHPELQKRRAEATIQGVEDLKKALGSPGSDHAMAQLANSALMIGYMGLTRARANSLTIKDAEMIRLERENLKLKHRVLKMREIQHARSNELHARKLRYEDIKYETAVQKLAKLKRELKALMNEGKLETETLEKIKEIYGIVKLPFLDENSEAELRAQAGQ
jgi:hypothetical protein